MSVKKSGMLLVLTAVLLIAGAYGLLRAEENIVLSGMECPNKVAVLLETVKGELFLEYTILSGQGQAEIVAVKSPVSGILSEIKIGEGSLVDAGQDLIVLNAGMSDEIKKLAAEAAKAKNVLTMRQNWKVKNEKAVLSASKDYQKALDLLNQKKAQTNLVVKAPLAGIAHLVMAPGSETAEFGLLLEISNPRQMLFPIPLADSDKGLLTVGDKFSGTAEGLSAEVAAEVFALNENQVVLGVNNNENQVKEGVSFTFKKLKAEHADAIVIPDIAVQKDSLGNFVYVAEKKKAKKVYVTLGASSAGKTMIENGLVAGTALIVSGFDCLADGKRIRIVNPEELARAKDAIKVLQEEKKAVEPQVKVEPAARVEASPQTGESRFRVGLIFGRFSINDENLRLIYANWFRNIPGIEFSVNILPNIDAWASAKLYSDKQKTTFFGHDITFRIIPISVGLRYRILKMGFMEPFVGAGFNLYFYSEKITGETDLEDTKGSALGFYFQGGSYFDITPAFMKKNSQKQSLSLLGEIFLKYNIIKKTLAELLPDGTDTFDLGGFQIGIGLGVKF